MNRLFGEFLIDQALVTTEQVVDALIEQLRSTPSTAEIIHQHGILSKPEIFKILASQQQRGCDFVTAANGLNLWSDTIAAVVDAHIKRLRTPLGEILVSQRALTLDQLTGALDKYIESFRQDPSVKAPKVEAAALPSAPVATPIDAVLANEYVEIIDQVFLPTMTRLLSSPDAAAVFTDSPGQALRTALDALVSVRAGAEFLGAVRSKAIASAMIEILELALSNPGEAPITTVRDTLRACTTLLDGTCRHIANFQTEELPTADSNMHDISSRFTQLCAQSLKGMHSKAS